MLQVLFRIPGLGWPIYSYGLMMVVGFLAAIQLAKYLARRCGLDPEIFVNAGLLALVTGIAGARLSHVLENFSTYTDPHRSIWANFFDAINIRNGGLTYYGGFLLAFPTLTIYAIKKKIPLRLALDLCAPCIVVGLGFGRIGCFLNGCCYGDRCDISWLAVQYPYQSLAYDDEFITGMLKNVPEELQVPARDGSTRLVTRDELARGFLLSRQSGDPATPIDPQANLLAAQQKSLPLHPAQLYSAFTAFFIAGITLVFFTLPHAPGRGFALMLMLEGSTRFILELLRVEPAVEGNFSLSMILGIALAAVGVLLWIIFGLAHRTTGDPDLPLISPAPA
jgi:phosphatidylglycerol:prolipoprotein diacylglycerol transferase